MPGVDHICRRRLVGIEGGVGTVVCKQILDNNFYFKWRLLCVLTGNNGTETIGISHILDSNAQTFWRYVGVSTIDLLLLLTIANGVWHATLLAVQTVLRLVAVFIGTRSGVGFICLFQDTGYCIGNEWIVVLVEVIVVSSLIVQITILVVQITIVRVVQVRIVLTLRTARDQEEGQHKQAGGLHR